MIKQMKNMKIKNLFAGIATVILMMQSACDPILDQEPLSAISPEKYLWSDIQLAAYVNGLYIPILPSGINLLSDQHTDNQAAPTYADKYVSGEWKVGQTDGSNWYFGNIYNCNYFLDHVLPRYEAGTLQGSLDNIKHYIGEVYFFRAYEYFKRYQLFGDFPIVAHILPDEPAVLTEASKRSPRNEVARFILSDLDKAIALMAASPDNRKTRVGKEAALLIKSRAALYEGTFLKYFKGTAFVPKGTGWPGAGKDYNSGYEYPSGNIDDEINFFLDQAIDASEKLASTITLTANSGRIRQNVNESENPYMDMFASVNPSGYSEVILWREFNRGLGVTHGVPSYAQWGDYNVGLTRGFAETFLMENGLPIYAAGSGYQGDDYISTVRAQRDNRLVLFLKEPGQKNILYGTSSSPDQQLTEGYPNILGLSGTDNSRMYNTGYAIRKGGSFDSEQIASGASTGSYTGLIIFRGVEVLLNYIEAWYERHGSLNTTATQYWQAIRTRARVDTDIDKTINATIMSREAQSDWGAYSAGKLLSDATLFNIRRERRCELIGEGMRAMDLQRWRAQDQMVATPYHIEGFKLWGPMQDWYKNSSGQSQIIYGLDNANAQVSPPGRSEYLRPYEKSSGSLALDGYRWNVAHYLYPIAIQDILITSQHNDLSTSPIYQNPGWTLAAGTPAIQ
jgi:hypothetical protein